MPNVLAGFKRLTYQKHAPRTTLREKLMEFSQDFSMLRFVRRAKFSTGGRLLECKALEE